MLHIKKNKVSKIVKISLITLLCILITLCITIFIIIHNYINKMNLVSENTMKEVTMKETTVEDNTEKAIAETETEGVESEGTTEITQSPQEDIVNLEKDIRLNTEENDRNIINSKDVYNILLIGSDSREAGGLGRSDAMIIVSINTKTNKIILTSLLRDIYLKIPGHSNNRINAAYAYGGPDLLIKTIEENFKINIDKYISIDFYAFINVVDSIGGVTLEVNEEDISIINNYIREINIVNGENEDNGFLTQAGNYILNGKQTLGYVRNRYIGTDFARTARQRIVLQKIFNQIKDLNLFKMENLLTDVLPHVTTNLTENKIISLLMSLPIYKNYEIEQWNIPMENTYSFLTIDGMSVIGIDFDYNSSELHKKVYE